MKADWDMLMTEFKDSSTVLVADVDCTASGESLCQQVGVQGYPTIKYGDPSGLQDYEGGRSLADLKSFAETRLGPQCGPQYLDLCDDKKKAEIAKFSAMSADELNAFIHAGTSKIEKLEGVFKSFVDGLQKQVDEAGDDKDAVMARLRAQYQDESTKKDAKVADVKGSGLGLAKAVKAFTPSKAEL